MRKDISLFFKANPWYLFYRTDARQNHPARPNHSKGGGSGRIHEEPTMIWEELNPSLLFTGLEAREYTDIFETLGGALVQKGYAKDSYVDALLEREQEFPTGLNLNGIGVALPHTDTKYVNQEGIAIASLNHPVTFFQMGTDCDPISVSLVFMLTVTNPSQHIDRLLRILEIIQDSNVLEGLIHAGNHQDIIEIMKAKEMQL